MNTGVPSYTVGELEEETGFDRRTIAYYVQEELLPRVGRRGRRTRYPRLVRDRLLFIRRVREAEEAGTVPPVSLSEMRKIFERVPQALIAAVADGRLAVTGELVEPASKAFRLPAMRRAALLARLEWRERLMSEGVAESPRSYDREMEEPAEAMPEEAAAPAEDREVQASPAPRPEETADAPPEHSYFRPGTAVSPELEARLADLLVRLQEVASRPRDDGPHSMDTWTRIDISPEIMLSVRNIGEDDRELLEWVRRAMRRVVLGGIAGD